MGEAAVKDELGEKCHFGAAFAVVSYCVSFVGCKHLLGAGAALLSTRKLQVSTGNIGQALSENATSFEPSCHLLFRKTISCKVGVTLGCCKTQGALAAGVTFLPWGPFALSSLLCNSEVSPKRLLTFNHSGETAVCLISHIKIITAKWAVIY